MENFINNAPFALVLVALVIGFVLLIKGADYFVEGSSSVAKRLHVPAIIIGLTIVAMGTSLFPVIKHCPRGVCPLELRADAIASTSFGRQQMSCPGGSECKRKVIIGDPVRMPS